MAKVNYAGVVFAVVCVSALFALLVVGIKMCLLFASDRPMYKLRYKIEPPSIALLKYFRWIDVFIWTVQLYLICLAFISYEELCALCDAAYPELGKYCNENFTRDEECYAAREERFDACQADAECDVFISSQYNLEHLWTCEGADCWCASGEAYFAVPMLMVMTFGAAFLLDIGKCFCIRWYFWEYLEIIDSRYFVMGFISDSPWLDCCTACLAPKSHEAIIHFYYYKRRYFRYNCCSGLYLMVRFIIFWVSALIMFGLVAGLETHQTDTIIAWYDLFPLFLLWFVNEFVLKLRYKFLRQPYSKREHVLFILGDIIGIDEYDVVKIIGDYIGHEELADYAIVDEVAGLAERKGMFEYDSGSLRKP